MGVGVGLGGWVGVGGWVCACAVCGCGGRYLALPCLAALCELLCVSGAMCGGRYLALPRSSLSLSL